jgi:hypothetical protein
MSALKLNNILVTAFQNMLIWVSMDIQDGIDDSAEHFRVNAVRAEPVVMTLDSGADFSVMPEESYLGVAGSSHLMKMLMVKGSQHLEIENSP